MSDGIGGLRLPLTAAQRGVWNAMRLEADTAAFDIGGYAEFRGELDPDLLEAACLTMVAEVEALRLRFDETGSADEVIQIVLPERKPALARIDLSGEPEPAKAARRWLDADLADPRDPTRDPLIGFTLLRLAPGVHWWCPRSHHLVLDGYSLPLICGRVAQVYTALAAGRSPAPSPFRPYRLLVDAEAEYRASDAYAADRAFWHERLADPHDSPTLSGRAPLAPGPFHRVSVVLAEDVSTRLARSWAEVTIAAFAAYLSRMTGTRDVSIAIPLAARSGPLLRVPGDLANLLPLRMGVPRGVTAAGLTARVAAELAEMRRHQRYRGEELARELGAVGTGRALAGPGVNIKFFDYRLTFGEIDTVLHSVAAGPVDDLTLSVRHQNGRIEMDLDANHRAYDEADAAAHLHRFAAYLADFAQALDDDAPVDRLDFAETAGTRSTGGHAHGPAVDPTALTLAEAFAAQARRTPHEVALRDGELAWTFAELDDRANRLAGALRRAGAAPERLVALAMPRGAGYLLGLLGVARSGAAWLPLDVTQPGERLAFMLRDGSPSVLLTTAPVDGRIAELGAAAGLPVLTVEAGAEPHDLPAPDPAALAYAVYTSGSTGLPKAVQVTHGALANLLDSHRRGVMTAAAPGRWRIGHTAPLTFDAALDPLLWMVAGHELVLVPEHVYQDAGALVRLVREQHLDYVDTTPSYLRELLDAGLLDGPGHRPSMLVFGGEAAPGDLWTRLATAPTAPRCVNAYGPTEYTVDALQAEVSSAATPVLGTPVAGTRALVLDDALRPVPEGAVGELYLGGPGLARGYGGRPGATATRFVADPYGPPGARLLRTGDVVRWRPGGHLDYLGRADDQVKIRGFRVEPREAEAVLAGHPAVARCAVVVRETATGPALVGYVVPRGPIDTGELSGYLRQRLPDYLVPAAVVPLTALPVTANGKLDVRALPDAGPVGGVYRAPATATEATLCAIFAELLGVERTGVDDDFFAMGGHSLTAARLLTAVRSRLGAELDLRAVFQGRTPAALARVADGARRSTRPPLFPALDGDPDRVPLSPAQLRFFFADRLDGESAVYNIPLVVRLSGEVDEGALAAALRDVVTRHESLRTTIAEDGAGPWQRVLDPADPAVTEALLTVRSAGTVPDLRVAEAAREPFDLTGRPPLRATLLRAPGADTLVLVLHHLAGDQGSTGPLLADLAIAYAARVDGRAPDLPPLPVQYRDYTRWQADLLAHDGLGASQLRFWTETLAGLPEEVPLARDRPRSLEATGEGATLAVAVEPDTHATLLARARQAGVTTFTVLQTATALVLSAFGAGLDVPLGTPVAGRPDEALDGLVGCFLNTVVLRTDLTGNPRLPDLLDRVQRANVAAFAHADVPFERVAEAVNPPRAAGRHPLFQIMVIHEYAVAESLRLGAAAGPVSLVDTGTAKFDLTVKFTERPGTSGIDVRLEYATQLFDPARIRAIADGLLTVLGSLADRDDRRVSDLAVLPARVTRGLLAAAEGPAVEVPAETLPELFTRAVARHPDRLALIDDATGRRLGYAELDAYAERVAAGLRSRGAGPGTIVAVGIPRSVELVVALYAVHKAGAAYLPLDPDHPAERTELMLADARPVTLLDTEAVRALGDGDPGEPSVGHRPAPLDAAYVIYTSGSTGRPKGVAVPHRAIVNRLAWMQDAYPLAEDDRVLQKTPAGFDVSVWEFFWPLLAGATLVLAAPGGHRDPAYLIETIGSHRVTTIHFVPSMLAAFLTDPQAGDCTGLRRVFCSGEALPAALVSRFRATLPAELHNLYGPTEAAVDVTAWRTTEADARTPAPIGRPVWNTGAHVLDRWLRPAPIGVPGELYLTGVQLASGYLRRPGLTAERFTAAPIGPAGARMYRTGDLARRRSDGAVEYLGRTDDQVKIRGVRIELGEVEQALLRHPGVRAAAATTRVDGRGNVRLFGYAVSAPGADLDVDEVRRFLSGIVPEALVPATIRVLDALPLTPSGKLDRRALPVDPAPDPAPAAAPVASVVLASPTRETVRALFAEVLDLPEVDPGAGFFALGGDSILAIQLVNRARAAGLRIRVRDVFTHQSVDALSRVAEPDAPESAPVADQADEGPVPLTPIMHWLRERGGWAGAAQTSSAPAPAGTGLAALAAAVDTLRDRHPMLRSRLTVTPHGHWSLEVPPREAAPPVSELVREVAAAKVLAEQERELARESVAALDPRAGIVSQWCLVTRGPGEPSRLVVTVHHLAIDTVSWGILWAELRSILDGLMPAGRPLAFRTWATHLHARAGDPAVLAEYDYWHTVAADPAPVLPVSPAPDLTAPGLSAPGLSAPGLSAPGLSAPGLSAPALSTPALSAPALSAPSLTARDLTGVAVTAVRSLDPGMIAPLWQRATREFGFTGEDLLLAAVGLAAVALRAPGGRHDVTLAVERHGREDEAAGLDGGHGTAGTVGWFTSLHPVRLEITGEPGAVLRGVKEHLRRVPSAGLGYGLLRYLNPQTASSLAALGEPGLLVNYLGHLAADPAGDLLGDGTGEAGAELVAYTMDTPAGRVLRVLLSAPADRHDTNGLHRFGDALEDAFRALARSVSEEIGSGRTPSDLTLPGLTQSDVDALDEECPGWEDVVPAGPLQEGLVALTHTAFHDAGAHPDVYTVQLRLRFTSAPDADRLAEALSTVFGRHVGLRIGLRVLDSGRVVGVIHPSLPVQVREHRVASAEDCDALARARRREPFDLAVPPLFRFDAVRLPDGSGTLIITGHHAAWDGWSAPLLVRELLTIYTGRPPGPDAAAAHLSYLRALATRDPGPDLAAWRELLDGLPGPTLLLPEAPAAGTTLPTERRVALPGALGDTLRRRAAAAGLTLNTLVQGAWGLLLARHTGCGDTVFGVTVAGRPPEIDGLDGAIGLFVTTIPARFDARPGDTFGDALRRLQDRQAATAEHQWAGLSAIQRAAGHGTLFDTLVVFENYPLDEASLLGPAGGEAAGLVAIEADDATHYPVTLTVFPGEEIGLALAYRTDLLAATAADALLAELRGLLDLFAAGLDAPVGTAGAPVADRQAAQVVEDSPEPAVTSTADGAAGILAALFAEILELPTVDPAASFLSLGGDSILAIQLVARARAAGLHITAADVFTHRTATALADLAVAGGSAARTSTRPASEEFTGAGLTPMMHWLREVGGPVGTYSQRMLLRLPAGVDDDRLRGVVQRVLDGHPMLRARLHTGGGDWTLAASGPGTVRAADVLTTITGQAAADPDRVAAEAAARIDPESGACTRWIRLDHGPDRPGELVVVVHHLAVDGVSWRVLMADLATAWHGTALPPAGTGFDDWTRMLAGEARTARRRSELAYWRSVLDAPPLLPAVVLDPAADIAATRRETTVSLPAAQTEALLGPVAEAWGAGPEELLLGALAGALAGWRGADPVAVMLEGHGRADDVLPADVTRTVGWFTTMYPVRLNPGGTEVTARAAAALRSTPDRGLGYGLLRHLNPDTAGVLERAPQPQVRFNYLGRFTAGTGRDWEPVDADEPLGGHADEGLPIPYPLEVTVAAVTGTGGTRLRIRIAWPDRHLDEDDVGALADGYLAALHALATDEKPVAAEPLPDPDDVALVDIDEGEIEDLWRNR